MADRDASAERSADTAAGKAPAPLAADVGIVAALAIEVGFLTDRLEHVRKYAGPGHTVVEGECGGKIVALVVAGPGRAAARAATDRLLAGHRPRWVLSIGFGGALNPDLRRNQIVLPDEVVDLDGARYAVESRPPGSPSIVTGRLLTVDAIVRTAAEKAELRRRFDADVVDMETSAVAAVCNERGVRFLAARVISDDAGHDLPREVVPLMKGSNSYRAGAALRALWNRPSSLKDFWALHEHAQEAADRIAQFTVATIAGLA
ncbi:MAG: nucleoside phosphorylase [Isosphaeraceae bacterium]|nr:nucleoside phosphorylase [Isosphaeraceae bacterium]